MNRRTIPDVDGRRRSPDGITLSQVPRCTGKAPQQDRSVCCRQGAAQPAPRSYLGIVILLTFATSGTRGVHDLLPFPWRAVLPRDDAGRLLLVRQIDTGNWASIGGVVEPDESPPRLCRAREGGRCLVEPGNILCVFAGPEYRVSDPNGYGSAYVVTVFDATVNEGTLDPAEMRPSRWAGSYPSEQGRRG